MKFATKIELFLFIFSDPPGPPEISGYIEGETIRLGQTVTLVCTAAGGNPLAEITWYRNGIKVIIILQGFMHQKKSENIYCKI